MNIEQVIADAGEHYGRIIRMMVDGVGYLFKGKKEYAFTSHSGDDTLGTVPICDVNTVVNWMKRHGHSVGKCTGFDGHPGLTFAWSGWYLINGRRI